MAFFIDRLLYFKLRDLPAYSVTVIMIFNVGALFLVFNMFIGIYVRSVQCCVRRQCFPNAYLLKSGAGIKHLQGRFHQTTKLNISFFQAFLFVSFFFDIVLSLSLFLFFL